MLLTLQGSVMTSSMVPPSVRINGYAVPTSYGENRIPVHPGPVRVDVDCQWMRTYGQASLDFHAQPGQQVPVYYALPWHQFTTGSIGHVKQKRKGGAAMFALLGGLCAFVLLIVLLAVL
jgi:hypothetical protein